MKFKEITEMAVAPKKNINNKDFKIFIDEIEKEVDQYLIKNDKGDGENDFRFDFRIGPKNKNYDVIEKFVDGDQLEDKLYEKNRRILNTDFNKRYKSTGWSNAEIEQYGYDFNTDEITINIYIEK